MQKNKSSTNLIRFGTFTKIKKNEFIEGYFSDKINDKSKYPFPISSNEPIDNQFIDKFIKIMNKCYDDDDYTQFLGLSKCRLCNKMNGSGEYIINNEKNGIKFYVPEGYIHYLKDHNVHPSPEFIQFINDFDI